MKRILDLDAGSLFGRLAAFSVRNAAAVAAAAGALAAAGLVLALGLGSSAGALTGGGSKTSKATAELHRKFGDDPVVVLVRGRLTGMLLTEDLNRILGLEGCIAGNAPAKAKVPAPVCREFSRRKPVQVVFGPGTFINEAAGRILDRLGIDPSARAAVIERAARRARRAARARGLGSVEQERAAAEARALVSAQFSQQSLQLAIRYGLNSVPALNNPEFVLQLVFAPALGAETPKPRFSYVFPGKDAAVIDVRLRPGLSDSEQRHAIDMVREAAASPPFKLKFGRYLVSGGPVLREGVASGLSHQLAVTTIAAVLFAALALLLAFRGRRAMMLPLGMALMTVALTCGLMRLTGVTLTPSSVAVPAVLVGLACAFALQLQERLAGGGLQRFAPALAASGLVAAAALLGILALAVPMTRTFGAFLIVGLVLAFVVTLTAGAAILEGDLGMGRRAGRPLSALRARAGRRLGTRPSRLADPLRRTGARLGTAGTALRRRGSGLAAIMARGATRALGVSLRNPRRTLGIALALAAIGWAAGTQVRTVSDLTRLVPTGRSEVSDARTLERETGTAGQVSVLVRGQDLSDPRAINWMGRYEQRVLARHGYSDRRPCSEAQLCPALSLTSLFSSGPPQTRAQARAVLRSLPPYFARNVITPDRRTANLAFVVHDLSAGDRRDLVDDLRAQLDPPAGITAVVAGDIAQAAEVQDGLETGRWTAGLAALAAAFVVLLLLYRRVEEAIVVLVPALLATGWVALAVFVLQVPLNPLSVSLGAIVVAFTAAFGVLVRDAYRRERAAGVEPAQAAETAYRASATPLLASALVLLAGFLALVVSDWKLLRDFGVLATVGLAIALAGAALVVPATLALEEEGLALPLPASRAELAALARRAGRRTRLGLGGAARAARGVPGALRRAAPAGRRPADRRRPTESASRK